MKERLQKIISASGLMSRRAAEELIAAGKVRVNGVTAALGDKAEAGVDKILVDGKALPSAGEKLYIMLNKPRGYVTTLSDEKGRKNVTELIKELGTRLYPVGRLDMYSEGLLLLTNDGALANRLTHPRHAIEKTYQVWVSGFYPGAEQKLTAPIEIDGKKTRPAKVSLKKQKEDVAMLEVVISEGRNRQIRRLCQEAGLTVTRLKRIQEGPLCLGDLPVGHWRYLEPEELQALRKH